MAANSTEGAYDVTILGGGPGGYVAAIRAAQLGFKTALVEGHKLGGECLNYGCIPSKALISAGHTVDKIKHGEKMGIHVEGLSVDLGKLVDWKSSIVKTLTGGVGQLLKANGVQVFQGRGEFSGLSADGRLKKIQVNTAIDSYDGTARSGGTGTQNLESGKVVIATGSSTIEIPSFKFNGKTILGSREALDVRKIPKKLVVIGGGFIGLEIGTFFSKLGTEVTVVEATSQLLPGTDRECVDVVQKKLLKKGVKILTQTKASKYEETASGVKVFCESQTGTVTLECDWVLVTVGRKSRTQNLGLEKISLATNSKGLFDVNSKLETSAPGVFAIGDVVGGPMLAHKASFEGMTAMESLKDPSRSMDIRALPWAIFVDPEISTVGHTEESARAAGWDPVIGKCPFAANGRALTTGESEGFVKIIADRKTDRILGAHMVGPDVSNLIAEVALAIELGATAQDLSRTVHAHPTLPETLLEAAESVHGMAVHFFEKKPRRHGTSEIPQHR